MKLWWKQSHLRHSLNRADKFQLVSSLLLCLPMSLDPLLLLVQTMLLAQCQVHSRPLHRHCVNSATLTYPPVWKKKYCTLYKVSYSSFAHAHCKLHLKDLRTFNDSLIYIWKKTLLLIVFFKFWGIVYWEKRLVLPLLRYIIILN